MECEDNNHEEADTLLIHQAVLASRRSSPNTELMVFSPDTDVLVLLIGHYDILLNSTSITMKSGVLQIGSMWTFLGASRAKALPAFHAFTGTDNTSRFSGIGKVTWLNIFLQAPEEIWKALQQLSEPDEVTEEQISILEKFVCHAYKPKKSDITNIPDLRWYLFCKNMADSEKLPPTIGALKQHILRAKIQARVWGQASVAQQSLPEPLGNGYCRTKDGQLQPLTTELLPAPEAILEMVRCLCKTNCSTKRCSCAAVNLPCTEICQCTSDCQNDQDSKDVSSNLIDSESDDDDDTDDD